MDSGNSGEGIAEGSTSAEDWALGIQVLKSMLGSAEGVVSSVALRRELERKGAQDSRAVVVRLRFTEPGDAKNGDVFWRHHGKSFYTVAAFEKAQQRTQAAADDAAATDGAVVEEAAPTQDSVDEPKEVRKANKQEEARLVTYVRSALEEIYGSEYADDAPYVFDVHNQRAGSDFENVDVIAVHWRSRDSVDLISVEVKLDFTSKLVQQARNYMRFSNRVWVAVPVRSEPEHAAVELRETDPRLFEHVIASGLGVLACHRRPGKRYDVVPVHWPRRLETDSVEREEFIERHRSVFEEARVVAPQDRMRYPRLK